jgi:hypothetical protein
LKVKEARLCRHQHFSLSCFVALDIVSTLCAGGIYRLVSATLAFAGLIIFSKWLADGRAVYGWFFDLF